MGEARDGRGGNVIFIAEGLHVRTTTGMHKMEARIDHVTRREGALGWPGSGPFYGLPLLFVSSISIFNDEVLSRLLAGALTEQQKW